MKRMMLDLEDADAEKLMIHFIRRGIKVRVYPLMEDRNPRPPVQVEQRTRPRTVSLPTEELKKKIIETIEALGPATVHELVVITEATDYFVRRACENLVGEGVISADRTTASHQYYIPSKKEA